MARKRRKSRNPGTPWLKYAVIAGGCYVAYRLLKSQGILGGNGDDESYTPAPVIKEVETVLQKATPSVMRTASDSARGTVVLLAQKKKQYDLTKEKYQQAPVLTNQAEAQYKSAQAAMDSAKARAIQLRNEAQAKGVNPVIARTKNIEAAKKEMEASRMQLNLPALARNVESLQANEKLHIPELKKLEGELSEAVKAREVNDFMQAAALATGGGVVAVEK